MNSAQQRVASSAPLVSSILDGDPPPLTQQEVDGIYAVGLGLYARERFLEASDVFRLLVLVRPSEARGWLALAASHEGLGDDERAVELYAIARSAPVCGANRRRASLQLARLCARLGRPAEARAELELVDLEDDDDPSMVEELAGLQRCLAETQRSIERAR
ncbi:MAG: hypothetical protein NVS3B10_17310 [Polyangiales bacterium]